MIRADIQICIVFMAAMVWGMGERQAGACPVCVMAEDSFSLPHPHAIRLAVATRAAIESGLIDEIALQNPKDFEAELVRAGNVVTYPFSRGQPVAFDVLLVDEGSVYRLELHGSRSRVAQYRPDVHLPALPCIVTTRAVVHALGSLQIRLAEAMSRGLLRLEVTQAATGPKDDTSLSRGYSPTEAGNQ